MHKKCIVTNVTIKLESRGLKYNTNQAKNTAIHATNLLISCEFDIVQLDLFAAHNPDFDDAMEEVKANLFCPSEILKSC